VRCQQLRIEMFDASSSIDVVRKSGPSQSGSTYSTCGASINSRKSRVGIRRENSATTKLRERSNPRR